VIYRAGLSGRDTPLPASARDRHRDCRVADSAYHTSNGTEVDLVLTLPGGKLWAVEINRSSAPKVERGFHSACADLKPNKRFVVYPGEERFSLDDETDAISVIALARALQAAK
jgi:uncharacterized protein